jgi:hypothetical protein
MRFRTERLLWKNHLSSHLVGRWWRIETRTLRGLPDVIGFYKGETHIIELKIGKPGIHRLRSGQLDLILEALRQGGPVWCLFNYRGSLAWFRGLPTGDPCKPPPFYRP